MQPSDSSFPLGPRFLIDCHCHLTPDAVLTRFPGGSEPRYVSAERTALPRMLENQEAAGITQALVSDSFHMECAAEELPSWSLRDRARLFNDELAELVARFPGRFFGLGCVDPFDGDQAALELEHMLELGFVGALVNPTDETRYLDDPAAEPLLSAAESLGLTLFVHPTRDLPSMEHYADFALHLSIGRLAQTGICAARLIFTGALDRYPDLRLMLAHGGGVIPFVAGRLDATWAALRPARWQGADVLHGPPSTYLRRFFCDSNTWSTASLRLVLDRVGSDRVVFGTDQPPVWFPVEQSVAVVDALDLPVDEAEAIRWRNAAQLFGLPLGDRSAFT